MKKKKTKEEIAKALEDNVPADLALEKKKEGLALEKVPESIVVDTEEDYNFIRKKLKSLLEKADMGLDECMQLASQLESPRGFEVLSGFIKDAAAIATQLMKLQEARQALHQNGGTGEGGDTNVGSIQNAIFVGSTSDLQKFLNKNGTTNANPVKLKKKEPIDAEVIVEESDG